MATHSQNANSYNPKLTFSLLSTFKLLQKWHDLLVSQTVPTVHWGYHGVRQGGRGGFCNSNPLNWHREALD